MAILYTFLSPGHWSQPLGSVSPIQVFAETLRTRMVQCSLRCTGERYISERDNVGSSMLARTAMMANATRSSIRVKPMPWIPLFSGTHPVAFIDRKSRLCGSGRIAFAVFTVAEFKPSWLGVEPLYRHLSQG